MKYHLLCAGSLAKLDVQGILKKGITTKEAFFEIHKQENRGATGELFAESMKGLYSYDVFDSPAFI